MSPNGAATFALTLGLLLPLAADAHFQELIPSLDVVTGETGRKVTLDAVFTHPMENGPAMEMTRPARFGVMSRGETTDLLASVKPFKVDDATAWRSEYTVKRPGDYLFFIEPAPYWEPSEGKMIVHYTKAVVNADGMGDGWDAALGLPVEIEPLVRPYGLWTGNLFRGVVRHNGEPVPFAEVEVEYKSGGKVEIPSDAHVTQVTKADAAGVFAYAMPRAGWWGFSALIDGPDEMKNPEGQDVPVELGGLIWVKVSDMMEKK